MPCGLMFTPNWTQRMRPAGARWNENGKDAKEAFRSCYARRTCKTAKDSWYVEATYCATCDTTALYPSSRWFLYLAESRRDPAAHLSLSTWFDSFRLSRSPLGPRPRAFLWIKSPCCAPRCSTSPQREVEAQLALNENVGDARNSKSRSPVAFGCSASYGRVQSF